MTVPNEASTPRRRPWAIAVAILVAVPLAAGVVQAAIPDAATGQITVCYKPHTGEMRLIDTQSVPACSSDETALSWNEKGPQGPPGQPGQNGQNGQNGPPGPPGLSGLNVKTDREPDSGGNSDGVKSATATCDPGTVVIGTAVNIDNVPPNPTGGGDVHIHGISPIDDTRVTAFAFESPSGTNGNWALRAHAFCAKVAP